MGIPRSDFDETTALRLHQMHGERIKIEFPNPLNNHCYVLQSKGCVGQIPVSDDRLLQILPKVPIINLFRMLEYAYNLKSFRFLDGTTGVDSLKDLFEHLVSVLVKRVLDRARKGLYRGYIREEQSLPYLRGRVLFVPSLRASMHGSARLECEYEEHTADLIDNRILAWTLFLLPRFGLKREDVRRQVGQAYRAISGMVKVARLDACDCMNLLYHRLNEDYRPMHGLCRFFLEHCGPGIKAGERDFIPFVLNMPALFESFVAEWLRANIPRNMYLTPQYRAGLDESGAFSFRIDLVLREVNSDRVLAVMDTKYKRHHEPEESDIQQIVAYAVRMNTKNAFLIYPSNATKSVTLHVGDVIVRSLTFDIGIEPDEGGRLFLEKLIQMVNCTRLD
ncbi:MAG: restriction endonuclease [Deltaproteobacteria bacterium]|nr:restriction endonuclease [Deltaproteobacteria bacterium]